MKGCFTDHNVFSGKFLIGKAEWSNLVFEGKKGKVVKGKSPIYFNSSKYLNGIYGDGFKTFHEGKISEVVFYFRCGKSSQRICSFAVDITKVATLARILTLEDYELFLSLNNVIPK